MYNIQEVLTWFDKFDKKTIIIQTQSKEFTIQLNVLNIPHLLGLHYISPVKETGRTLLHLLSNKTDDYIYDLIQTNNPSMLQSVQNRVEYFKLFMENLHKATLYEQTHPTTKIKSDFLLVKLDENNYIHLGLASRHPGDDYLETFFVRKDNGYYKDSKIEEPIIAITQYQHGQVQPFSFSKEVNDFYQEIQYGLKEELFQKLIQEIPFENLETVAYQGLTLYPIYLEDNLEEMSLKQITNYLEVDSMNMRLKNKLAQLEGNNLKNENEEFYSSIGSSHKQCDFFFSLDTRNIYIPTNSGLMKYNKYTNEELLNVLMNCFEKQLHINQEMEVS